MRWNTPIVRAYYLKEAFQLFWDISSPNGPAITWRNGCVRPCAPGWSPSRNSCACCVAISMECWTNHRVSNGAVEGMNNKIKSISHRSFGFRTAENFIAAIYHSCAKLPLPLEC